MGVQFVQVGKGGTVTYHAPERWAASPAPTVTLYGPEGGELVASQAATLGPTTTLDAAAAAGQTTVPLTATTSIVIGEQYLITNATGEHEWVTVEAISSGVSVTVRDDLIHTYASTNVFCSTKMSVTMTSAQAAAPYRSCYARWAYSVSSETRLDTSVFHLTRWSPRLNLTAQDILRREPRAIDLLGTRQDIEELITDIWENEILEDLAQSCDPGALLSGETLRMATLYRVIAEMYLHSQDAEHSDALMGMYRAAWERVLATAPIDVDQSGSVSADDIVRPAWTGRVFRG